MMCRLLLWITRWGGRTMRLLSVAQQERCWLQEELVSIIEKARKMLISPRPIIVNWKTTSVLSATKKILEDWLSKAQEGEGTEIRGKYRTGGWWYWLWLFSVVSLLVLQFAIQKNLSKFWIQVLLIMFVPSGGGLLVLKKIYGSLMSFGDGHTCQIEGIGIVRSNCLTE